MTTVGPVYGGWVSNSRTCSVNNSNVVPIPSHNTSFVKQTQVMNEQRERNGILKLKTIEVGEPGESSGEQEKDHRFALEKVLDGNS
jgi:hypothetical protein